MKIKKVRKSKGRIEVTFTDKGKNLMQVFQTEQEFKRWLKANKLVSFAKIAFVIVGFVTIISFLVWIISVFQ